MNVAQSGGTGDYPGALSFLVVDDPRDANRELRETLAELWPQGRIVVRAAEALSVDDLISAHVLLLHHPLPAADSFAILDRSKALSPSLPVVLMTEHSDEQIAVRAIKAGADDYLSRRRLNPVTLRALVQEALRSQSEVTLKTVPRAPEPAATGNLAIRGYRILERLASGAQSTIFAATREGSEEKVVLKVLSGLLDEEEDGETLERFLAEYQAVSELDHPSVINIRDLGVADDKVFIVMDHLEHGSLRQRLRAGPVGEEEAVALLGQIVIALDAIHSVGTLHRDLKPGNIMFLDEQRVCLIDFGLAKRLQLERSLTAPGKIYGTPYYMSPEQGQGQPIDERSDLYSLGIVFYEMLTGRKPFVASTPVALMVKHCHAPRPLLPERLGRWQRLLDSLLATDPSRRPESARKVLEILEFCKTM